MAQDNPIVSVLVPTYNVERYVLQCLDALCGQTLREIEIIVINDGSTDGSAILAHEKAAADGRVVVLDKKNSGYGASMNRGIERARGKYIGIVEPDDYPERSMFKRLVRACEKHDCELAKCDFFELTNGRNARFRNLDGFPFGSSFDPADHPNIICTVPSIWTGLYRRSLLDREGIRFRETPGASFQDTSFVMKTWFAARSCVLVRKPLLHYRMDNPDSSVKTTDKAFVVCDELAESEAFLRERPARCVRFAPWFHVDKWGKYRWNYERVDESLRIPFAKRMRDEYEAAREMGELDLKLFGERDRGLVQELLDGGFEAFVERHQERY